MPDDIEFDDINNDKGLYEEWKDEPISSASYCTTSVL
jgi:hypothetical protein